MDSPHSKSHILLSFKKCSITDIILSLSLENKRKSLTDLFKTIIAIDRNYYKQSIIFTII